MALEHFLEHPCIDQQLNNSVDTAKGPEHGTSCEYQIQGAIAAVHSEAKTADGTEWLQIVALYQVLMRINFSPVDEVLSVLDND